MTDFVREQAPVLAATQDLRRQLMSVLTDQDLHYAPASGMLALGELCRQIGETQQCYIDSFRTRKQSFDYRHDAAVAHSVAALIQWYDQLDTALQQALEALDDEDLTRPVQRGHGFAPPVTVQFHIYREALLIFYAKAHVYLRGLDKSVPGAWQWWVGDRDNYT